MAVTLNKTGESAASALIRAGKYDMTASWAFSSDDGDKLLGTDGKDWTSYAKWFLGVNGSEADETKSHWEYPYGKDGKVFRRALSAIRSRAKANDAGAVYDAAGRLLDVIDEEENKKNTKEQGTDPDDDPDDDDDDPDDDDAAKMAASVTETRAALERIEKRLNENSDVKLTRRFVLRMEHASLDANARTVDMVVSSGAAVRRYDWTLGQEYDEVLSMDPKSIRMDRLNAGAPFLDSHDYYSGLVAMIGSVVPGSARVENGELVATAKFSTTPEGERAFQMAMDGTLRFVSVGYQTHEQEIDDTTDPPTYRATDWEPYEVSAVAMPADPKAGFRSATPLQERTMTATTEPNAVATATARSEAIAAERKRTADIAAIGARLKLPAAFIQKHVDDGTEIEAFRSAAIDEVATRTNATVDASIGAPAIIGRHRARELSKQQQVGRLIRIYGSAKGNPDAAVRLAGSKEFDDGNRDFQVRALTAGIGASGGFLIPEEYWPEIIELLRNRAVVRKLGALAIPMEGGNLTMPRLQSGATASYQGEATAFNASQESFGQVKYTEKKLMALVPVSNDLLKFASPQADEVVLNDMLAQMAVAEDTAFIRGPGTQFSPKGMRYSAPASTNILDTAGTGLANFVTDLEAMESALEGSNVRMIKPAIILNPRSKNAIKLLQSTTGQFVFRDEMKDGTLDGYPFGFTNSIPKNLGSGAQTEWYLVDMADAVIADVPGLEIEISREAAYVDGTGTMQAAFSQDVTVLRTVQRHDFAMRHDVSVAVMTQVAY